MPGPIEEDGMSESSGTQSAGPDAFGKFWTDMMGRMAGGAGAASSAAGPDAVEAARKAFFSSLADQADATMRSEAFLSAMKQAMDNALNLKEQVNAFLSQGLQAARMPSRDDTDHIVLLLRGMEERLAGRLDELSARVERLERRENGSTGRAKPGAKRRSPPGH